MNKNTYNRDNHDIKSNDKGDINKNNSSNTDNRGLEDVDNGHSNNDDNGIATPVIITIILKIRTKPITALNENGNKNENNRDKS